MSNNSGGKSMTLARYIHDDNVKTRINQLLAERTPQFVTSLISAVNASSSLAKCEPRSVLTAALTAASMKLEINPNLGFAYLIPYDTKNGSLCQFQMGYKGFIQLAQRSGLYKTINAEDVREGEIISRDRLSGDIKFNWADDKTRQKLKVVGYVAYFELLNGFSKMLYMTTDELLVHAKKYSKAFAKTGAGVWVDEFDGMAKKTVLKLLISKYGALDTELQKAVVSDQVVDGAYVDNPNSPEAKAEDAEEMKAMVRKKLGIEPGNGGETVDPLAPITMEDFDKHENS